MQQVLQLLVQSIVKQSFLVYIIDSRIFGNVEMGIVSTSHTPVVVHRGYGRVDRDLLIEGIYRGLPAVDAEGAQSIRIVQALQMAAFQWEVEGSFEGDQLRCYVPYDIQWLYL